MEFSYNPPEFEVTFTDETPWQRQRVLMLLSILIDEDVFIRTSNSGDILRTVLPSSAIQENVEHILNLAAQTPQPQPSHVATEKVVANNRYL